LRRDEATCEPPSNAGDATRNSTIISAKVLAKKPPLDAQCHYFSVSSAHTDGEATTK
jgi:hypothetical protein